MVFWQVDDRIVGYCAVAFADCGNSARQRFGIAVERDNRAVFSVDNVFGNAARISGDDPYVA